jgi:hypothetical protein
MLIILILTMRLESDRYCYTMGEEYKLLIKKKRIIVININDYIDIDI